MFLGTGRKHCGSFKTKSSQDRNSLLVSFSASLKDEITSEIKSIIKESQKEMLKLLKPKTGDNMRENMEEGTENETRSFYTLTKSVRTNSTQNNDPNASRKTAYRLGFAEKTMRFY